MFKYRDRPGCGTCTNGTRDPAGRRVPSPADIYIYIYICIYIYKRSTAASRADADAVRTSSNGTYSIACYTRWAPDNSERVDLRVRERRLLRKPSAFWKTPHSM